MMGIVTGCHRESPLNFRADPQIGAAARRWRIRAAHALIAALISTASSVVGAAQLPALAWLRSESARPAAHQAMNQARVPSEHGTVLAALIRPAPSGRSRLIHHQRSRHRRQSQSCRLSRHRHLEQNSRCHLHDRWKDPHRDRQLNRRDPHQHRRRLRPRLPARLRRRGAMSSSHRSSSSSRRHVAPAIR